jgi:iron complex transport system permease protein
LLKIGLFGLLLAVSSLLFLFWGFPPEEVVLKLRGPELLSTLSYGGVLALSGGVYQNALRNPLAEPYTLGVAAGSALGATAGLWLGGGAEAGALTGGALTVLLLFIGFKLFKTPYSIILMGVGLSALFGSLILLLYALLPAYTLQDALYFTLGLIQPVSLKVALGLVAASLLTLLTALKFKREIELLPLGAELAYFSGVDYSRATALLLLLFSIPVALFVSQFGVVGFLGLAAPHAVRLLGFKKGRSFIFLTFLSGALLLTLSQLAAKLLLYPTLLPAGVITGVFGAPVFLLILWRFGGVRG